MMLIQHSGNSDWLFNTQSRVLLASAGLIWNFRLLCSVWLYFDMMSYDNSIFNINA